MREALKGKIERQISRMMSVPINVENIINPEFIYYNLKSSDEFNVVDLSFDGKKRCPVVKLRYKGKNYNISFSIENIKIPKGYKLSHSLSKENIQALHKASMGIVTYMHFSEDIVESYFLQLKVLNCMVPDSAGIIDFSAEKIYSPFWVSMACESAVPPAPNYIFNVHAVGDERGVWLHTHGLNRCGFVELEILGSTTENYAEHYGMLNEMASSAIANNNMTDEYEPYFVARLANGSAIINTWVDYKKGLKLYDNNIIGGINERKQNHNKNTAIVFNYPTKSDYENKNIVKIGDLPREMFENPLVMITNEETNRMTVLAQERFSFLRDNYNKSEEIEAIIKVRLKVDEDKGEEAGSSYEHIWFDVKEVSKEKIVCILSQEPYYIEDMHVGDEMEIEVESISDWRMFCKGNEITPDSCYLLVEGIIEL